uniref:CCHC-type domain-containing protein n=1 Tax=Ixodes ricinus TaxID=34613 RepID=A0A6B0V9Z5_IXORI
MSSSGASITALAGRGSSVSSADSENRIVLPPLPSGAIVRNSVLLHGDVSARPYKIGDFRAEMERLGVIGHIEALGAYQMNHLWMVTFKTEEAKLRLVTAKELEVKGKRCIVVDPENADVRMKLHWLPFHVSDETVRKALEPLGKVQDLTREKWKAEGFAGVQSTTRLVRLSLKEGVTLERLPHQLRIAGSNVLVVIPGRDPLCLRCKGTGHIRRECRVPRCDECHRFGHEQDNCVRTYATVTQGVVADGDGVLNMDEEEAEEAARDVETEVSATAGAKEAPADVLEGVHPPQLQPEGDAVKPDPPQASSSSPVVSSDVQMAIPKDVEVIQALESKDTSQVNLSDDNSDLSDASETIMLPGEASARSEFKWHKNTTRRERFNPKPRILTEERRRSAPQ